MFNKNGKFKLWFWGTMFVILTGLGVTGLVYKRMNTEPSGEDENASSSKTSEAILIEGNMPSLADEATLKDLALTIFNDGQYYLSVANGEVTLSDTGKITSTAKYLYLNNEITYDDGVSDTERTTLITRIKDLYGDYVKLDDFKINYGKGVCSTTGYDSINGEYGDGVREPSINCQSPFLYYVTDLVRYDKNTYVIKVNALYVKETDYTPTEEFASDVECEIGESKLNRTISLYKNASLSELASQRNTEICCLIGSECPSAGIMKLDSNIASIVKSTGNTYLLRYEKDKDTKEFTLKKIEIK